MASQTDEPDGKDAQASALMGENIWVTKIERWKKTHLMRQWRESCERIRRVYRYENSVGAKARKYALLWSNTQTMRGATYAKPPKANVSRRYLDKDPTARVAATMIERCIDYTLDTENFDFVFKQVRDDFLLEARGVARVVYEPVMEEAELEDDDLDVAAVQGPEAAAEEVEETAEEDDEEPAGEVLAFERVKLVYIHPEDFCTNPARTWEEVKVVAFRSFLNREQLIKHFGKDKGSKIPTESGAEHKLGRNRPGYQDEDDEPKGQVWEIWDREENRVRWVARGYPETLEESPPYLKFDKFFPCPKPAYGTCTNDTLAPRADYVFYQDQAEEINALTARIASLQDSLKLVGFYPGGPKGEGVPEVERAVTPGIENKMIAVIGWDNFTSKGNAKSGGVPVIWLPIDQVAQVLEGCVMLRKQLIDDVNQIYGIADIMRGDSDPQETATAQRFKNNYGSIRIRERQAELARFCRDVTRLVGEVICNHFQPETVMGMSNMPLPTDAAVQQAALEASIQARLAARQQMLQLMAQQRAQAGASGGPPGQPAALPPPGGASVTPPGGPPQGAGGPPAMMRPPPSPSPPRPPAGIPRRPMLRPPPGPHPATFPGARPGRDGQQYVKHPATGQSYRVDRKRAS